MGRGRALSGSRPRVAPLVLAAGVLCTGSSAVFVKIAHLPGPVSAFYRVAFGALGALLWCAVHRPRPLSREVFRWTALGGLLFGGELALWQIALQTTSAANATLLAQIAPVWVGLGAFVFLRERQPWLFWLGLAVALGGVAVVARGSAGAGGGWMARGDAFAFAASFLYAGYLLVTRRVRGVLDSHTFMLVSALVSSAALLPLCLAMHLPLAGFAPHVWGALLALGLFSHFVGYMLITYSLGYFSASAVSSSLLAQPLVTASYAAAFLGEGLRPVQIAGGVVVLAGLAGVQRALSAPPQLASGQPQQPRGADVAVALQPAEVEAAGQPRVGDR